MNLLKNSLVRGTLILTVAGLLSRLMGFGYRIILARYFSSEGLGLFQLIFPIITISFSLCCSGISSAISKFTAAAKGNKIYLKIGTFISLLLSVLFSLLIYFYADFISVRFLMNADCGPYIKFLSFCLPFSSLHGCLNAYYYGKEKAFLPAFSQIIEQIVRIFSTIIAFKYCLTNNIQITLYCALIGNLIGELSACFVYYIIHIIKKCIPTLPKCAPTSCKTSIKDAPLSENFDVFKKIICFSIPLTLNQLLMHLLESGETILFPANLQLFGMSSSQALSVFGIMSGMTLPIILFPSAITNSLAVMLMPRVSNEFESKKDKNNRYIPVLLSLSLCMYLGFFCTLMFVFYGGELGAQVFNEPMVNKYIYSLSILCPFLYLKTTLTSVLNGMNLTLKSTICNICGICLRLAFLILLVPKYGTKAYILGLVLSNLLTCILLFIVSKQHHLTTPGITNMLIAPINYSVISNIGSKLLIDIIKKIVSLPDILIPISGAILSALIFIILIVVSKPFSVLSEE